MSEKRKPHGSILLKNLGKGATKKTNKIELFKESDFNKYCYGPKRYRIRVNGKWIKVGQCRKSFFTKWEFRDMLFRSINL